MEKESRRTIQKQFIWDAVSELKNHPTAEEIYEFVKGKHPNISKGTVYRNLGQMSDCGEVKRVEIPNAPDRFDYQTHNHYHIKCKVCGRVFDSVSAYDRELIDRSDEKNGFIIEDFNLLFLGICPSCLKSH